MLKTAGLLGVGLFVFCICATPMRMAWADTPSQNVYEALHAQSDLSNFAKLVDQDGLQKQLEDPKGKITIFVPTNQAMEALPNAVVQRIEHDPKALHTFVGYHIISGSVVQTGNLKGRQISPFTMSGAPLSINGLEKKGILVNDIHLDRADLQVPGGIIHVIDKALIAPSLRPDKIEPRPVEAQAKDAPPLSASARQQAHMSEQPIQEGPATATASADAVLDHPKGDAFAWFKALWAKFKAKFF